MENIVIVIDTSNYRASYGESTPFKARVTKQYPNEIWVESLVTKKEYEKLIDKGYSACKKFYNSKKEEFNSPWSNN